MAVWWVNFGMPREGENISYSEGGGRDVDGVPGMVFGPIYRSLRPGLPQDRVWLPGLWASYPWENCDSHGKRERTMENFARTVPVQFRFHPVLQDLFMLQYLKTVYGFGIRHGPEIFWELACLHGLVGLLFICEQFLSFTSLLSLSVSFFSLFFFSRVFSSLLIDCFYLLIDFQSFHFIFVVPIKIEF